MRNPSQVSRRASTRRRAAWLGLLALAVACVDSLTAPDAPRLGTTSRPPVRSLNYGALVVDPADPSRLRFADGSNFYMCAAGDPEGFLYRGVRRAEGTRSGDQDAIIDKLGASGANGIYVQIVRSHGGGGASNHNPFVDGDPAKGLDDDILAQWDQWFTRLEQAGVLVHIVFYDDSARLWDTDDAVGREESAFVRAIVDRFEHHPFLIWVVAEEYGEAYTASRVSNIASQIRAADDFDHIIAVHKSGDTSFDEFANDPNIEQFAMQSTGDLDRLHAGAREAHQNAAGRYALNLSEADGRGSGALARQRNWGAALAGATATVFGWDVSSTATSELQDCGRQVEFLQRMSLAGMRPRDDLARGDTRWVLAEPGRRYLAYTPTQALTMGVAGVQPGAYDLTWFDTENGRETTDTGVRVSTSEATWPVPAGFTDEIVLWIRPSESAAAVATPYDSGLLAWYHFDAGAGESATFALDFSGNGRNASCSGSACPTFVAAGRYGGGADFDGANDALSVGSFTPPTRGTVAFWFRADKTNRQRFLGGHDAYEVTIEPGAGLANQLFAAGSAYVSGGQVTVGQWRHVAFTYDGVSRRQEIWLDGALIASGPLADDIAPAQTLSIGTRTGESNFYDGRLDELAIWGRVLTAGEVAWIFQNPPPSSPPPPDQTPPSVVLTSPAEGATVWGTQVLSATATDPSGVVSVTFRVDGAALGTDSVAPYQLGWTTTAVSNGSHTVTAVAVDSAANSATSPPLTVTVTNSSTGGNPYPSGLLAWYHFDLGAGESATLAKDFSGNNRNATCSGTACPTFVIAGGRFGGAADFDGSNDALGVGSFTPPTRGTVAFWFRTDRTTRQRFLGGHDLYEVTIEPGGVLSNQLFAAGSAWVGGGQIAAGQWRHAVFTYDNVSRRQEIWLDGALLASGLQADDAVGSMTLSIGRRTGASDLFDGRLDELGIWGRVLTGEEVAWLFQNPPPAPLDETPPSVAVTSPAQGATLSGTQVLSATATDAGGIRFVTFRVDGTALGVDSVAPYQLGWTTTAASNGSHTLTAVAVDLAGNSATSAPVTVTVFNDLTPPSVSVTSPAAGATVSGTQVLSATATDAGGVRTVTFRVDGVVLGVDSVAPYQVGWTTTTASNGSHAITAVAVDLAGNSATSAPVTVTVFNDLTPPSVSVTSPAAGATVSGTQVLTATATDASGIRTVTFRVDGVALGTDSVAPYQLGWTTTAVSNGSHAITAVAVDSTGNSATSAPVTVTVSNDLTPPSVAVTSPAAGATVSGTQVLTATATDASGIRTVTFRVDGVALGTDSVAPYQLGWTTTDAANGSHTVTAVAVDVAGNPATSAPVTVTVFNDLAPPSVALTSPAEGATVSGTQMLSATASDASGIRTVTFRVDVTAIGTDSVAPYQLAWTTTNAANGSHSITAVAVDSTGNPATSAPVTVTVFNDQMPPSVALTSPADGATVSGTQVLSATASDASGIRFVTFRVDGATLGADSVAPYQLGWTTTDVADGSHTVTAVAVDSAGNSATTAPLTVTVSNDQTPPSVALTSPADGATLSGTQTLSATATDASGIRTMTFRVDGAALGVDSVAPYQMGWTTSAVSNGSHTVTAVAVDLAGNSATSVPVTVTVDNDQTPPSVALTAPADGATVSGTQVVSATATDASGILSVTFRVDGSALGADSVAPYQMGWSTTNATNASHAVTAVVVDSVGNSSTSAPVTVTVFNDQTPPSVALTSPTEGATVAGTQVLTATATDASGVASVTFRVDATALGTDSVAPYQLGWTTTNVLDGSRTITAVAVDSAGNSATSAPVTITVSNDQTPPSVALASPADGATVSGAHVLSATASDASGIRLVTFRVDGAPLGADSVAPYQLGWTTTNTTNGSHTVTAVAVDLAGNSATSAPVTVTVSNDLTPPSVALTSPVEGATVSGTHVLSATATDASGVASVTFRVDSAALATDSVAPYQLGWTTTAVSNGSHTLTVVAVDSTGNSATSAPVTVTVANDQIPPSVSLTSPANGTTVSGTHTLAATATDAGGIASVAFRVDSTALGTDTTAPYQLSWTTTNAVNGSHTLTAVAVDSAGNSSTSTPATVMVFNDQAPPSVAVTSPAGGATVSGTQLLSATATDDASGVLSVTFRVNGTSLGADSVAPYQLNWTTMAVADGSHTVTAVAVDSAGKSATSAPVIVAVDNIGGGPYESGLLAWYHFDLGTGESATLAKDFSGNNRNATCSGTACPAFLAGGRFSGGADFDGVNDALGAGSFTAPTRGTVAFWFRTDRTTRQRFLGGHDAYEVTIEPGGVLSNQLFAAGSAWVGGGQVAAGQWRHAVFTYDNGSRRQEIWLDGSLLASGLQADDAVPAMTLSIGRRTGASDLFDGRLDEVVIWNRVLTPGEVAYVYAGYGVPGGSPPPPPDLTPPSVTVTSPSAGATVAGWVPLAASATDPSGVASVTFRVDGNVIGSDATAPYQAFWNSSALTLGSHSITAVATDGAGNAGSSAPVVVEVGPPPPPVFPGATWQLRSPAQVGMDSTKLDEIASRIGGSGVIIKDGYMVKSWGTPSATEDWASAAKPVVSTLLFFAIQEGRLGSVNDLVRPHVLQLFERDLSPKDTLMTFAHLANMTSGYALPEAPGTAWGYNDFSTNLYAKLLFDRIYGQSANTVATTRLAPLQFQDGALFGSRGGYGLMASVRDFARIGWLWLHSGNWAGNQLLPRHYFDNYMKAQVPAGLPRTVGGEDDYLNANSFGGGTNQNSVGPGIYGFNWWFNPGGVGWPDAPHDLVHANGHGDEELLFAIPSLNVVIAARGFWGTWEPNGGDSGVNQILKILKESVGGGL